jgi:uncharacterized protein YbdZ (MbtH family)
MRVFVDCPIGELDGIVADDAELDGTFTLTTNEGERFSINGWQCSVEIVAPAGWDRIES